VISDNNVYSNNNGINIYYSRYNKLTVKNI